MTIQTTPYQDEILKFHAALNNEPDVEQWAAAQFALHIKNNLEAAYIAAHVEAFTAKLKDDAARPEMLKVVNG